MVNSMIKPTKKDIDRFWKSVEKTDGCWIYKGGKTNGYGQFSYGGRGGVNTLAHRFSYMLEHGSLPPKSSGLCLDHLCRRRSCVNPSHLELVSIKENVLRGIGISAKNAKKTHCLQGHEFTEENTHYKYPKKGGVTRLCLLCEKARWKRYNLTAKSKRNKDNVSRLEIIDRSKGVEEGGGRVYVNTKVKDLWVDYQDGGRTMKVFINESKE